MSFKTLRYHVLLYLCLYIIFISFLSYSNVLLDIFVFVCLQAETRPNIAEQAFLCF